MLHTASSGPVPTLTELYLHLDDGVVQGLGEVRTNIADLNGLEPDEVVAAAPAALHAINWRRPPGDLITALDGRGSGLPAPVRMLVDVALHDLSARRAGVPVATSVGAAGTDASWPTNQTLFRSPFEDLIARAERYVGRGFRDLKVRVGEATSPRTSAAWRPCGGASAGR